ncbi:hypothetical protein [Streptosporangium sp. NPDC048865]|uniref:hypothetical protein n=1 Tax=Streptosporangium sp. NPDC048865 TaxID=3155766 RepID=UPI003415FE80
MPAAGADEALERVCQEYFELGEVLLFAFENPQIQEWTDREKETESDKALTRLIERAHAEGVVDPGLPATWVSETMWALLYSAWQYARNHGAAKHASLDLCLRTFKKATAATGP